jgi:PAS domain S-box-containing protein
MRILIVEDNKDSRNLLMRQLNTHGHDVISTANGVEALEQALAQPPDVIISDIMMPKMDGYQLCGEFKQNIKLRDIPFIFYTATYNTEEDEKFALSLGAAAFIRKPSDPDTFFQLLSEIVSNTRSGIPSPSEIDTSKPSLFLTEYTKRVVSKLEDKVAQLTAEITERKKVEEKLHQYEYIVYSSTDMLALLDKQFNYLAANKTYTEAFNLPHERVIGNTVANLFGEEFFNTVIKPNAARCFRGEEVKYQDWFDFPAYGKRYMDITYYPYYAENNKIMGFVVNGRNITERKKTEEELELRAEMLNQATDGILLHDLDGNFIYVNDTVVKERGYSRGEFLRMNVLDMLSAEYYEQQKKWWNKLKSGEYQRSEFEVRCKDGTLIPMEANITKVCYGGKEFILSITRNVTERKKIEETLRQSEEMYSTLIEKGTDAVIVVQDGLLKFINSRGLEMTGFSNEDVLGKPFIDFISPQYQKQVLERYKGRIDGEEIRNVYETVLLCKDGSSLPVEASAGLIDYNGRQATLTIARDITERKKTEEELILRAEMLNQASDGIMLRDFDGNLLYANETAVKERGYTVEEFFKLNARNLVVAEPGAGKIEERWQEIMEKGYRHTQYNVRRKDRSLVPMDAMATKIKSGDKEYILSVTRNITEQKKAQEQIKTLSSMVEQSTEGMAIADLDGNLIFVNDTWCKMHGYQSSRELLGKNISISHNREQIENDVRPFNEKVKELGAYSGEVGHITRDGIPFPTLMTTTLLKNEQGKPYAIAGIARDISEQKRMEAEKAEMERKAQVASRLASVGEMASGIAHEINNPLTGVVGFAQLLAERKDLPDDVREQLKIIHEGGQRVSNIIKGLLSFARQSKPKREYVDINEVVEGTLRLSHYELETGNIEVIKQLAPELPWTMADAGQLQQVFINLVVNAQQEMRKAHGKGRLEIKTELAGGMIHISFKDDGPGIAEENIERIFDPFFTTKETGKGTGLGLSLSHGIIAEHGGQLYAESELGEGATFVVELPMLAEEVEIKEAKVADKTGEVIKGRILVVDDEEVVRQYLNSVLTKMGHIVEMATDGNKALELVKSARYNLILSDMKMPGMNGKEFYRRVREIAPSLTRRVVFITGDVMGEDTHDFIRKTGALYLTKPFDAGQLRVMVNDMLGSSI